MKEVDYESKWQFRKDIIKRLMEEHGNHNNEEYCPECIDRAIDLTIEKLKRNKTDSS